MLAQGALRQRRDGVSPSVTDRALLPSGEPDPAEDRGRPSLQGRAPEFLPRGVTVRGARL